jgi:hypothetical protein
MRRAGRKILHVRRRRAHSLRLISGGGGYPRVSRSPRVTKRNSGRQPAHTTLEATAAGSAASWWPASVDSSAAVTSHIWTTTGTAMSALAPSNAPPQIGSWIAMSPADGLHVARFLDMPHRFSGPWIAAACALVVAASCAAKQRNQPAQQTQLVQAVSAPERLRPPDDLSEAARAILKTHMASHARNMGQLMSSIMVLRYEQISEGARRIADDASLSRPLSADATELNSALPEKFFLYQDNLRLESKTLAEAAGRRNPFDVADSYGRLSQVCVRCHATYRAGH